MNYSCSLKLTLTNLYKLWEMRKTHGYTRPLSSEQKSQTCHSIEMKNLDLTNKKLGSEGKKSGSWSNRLQKEITHPKRRLFVVSFF